MRPDVERLVQLGPFPSEGAASTARVHQSEALLRAIEKPATASEADALVELFGPDNCFGLAWTLLHLIERAPDRAVPVHLVGSENRWIVSLRDRT